MNLNRFGIPVAALVSVLLGAAVPLGGQGGGGAAQQTPPLTPAQSAAVGTVNASAALQEVTQAVTAAQTALVQASLAQPANQADIRAKAQALADAETKLAVARGALLATVQESLRPLTPAQALAALSGRGGRGAVAPDTNDGFVSLFDGATLNGWKGDPTFWSVKDGVIHAESTPEKVVTSNTFLIWDGTVKDFELKVDYRFVGSGNSGVQVRSRMANPATRPFGVAGYQMDMVTAGGTGSGVFYTEGGGFGLTPQGAAIRAAETPQRTAQLRQIGSLGTAVADAIKPGPEWNTYHIIAHHNVIIAFVNGRMTAMLVDDNRSGAQYAQEGLLALQMHTGQPFVVEFKNVYLKKIEPQNLTPTPAPAGAGRGGQ